MPIEAVIFDMDGVLVDSEEYWWQSRVEFASALGKTWTMDDQRAAMGRSTIEWAQVMQERLALDMTLDEIMAQVIALVLGRLEARLPVLPGAIDAVTLCASSYRIALASGSPTLLIDTIMRLTGLDGVFEAIIYGDDMKEGKPAPEIYLTAAERIGVDPKRCLGIEDSGNGLRALRAADMIAIAVPSPGFPLAPDALALAHHVLPSLEHLTLDVIEGFA